MHSKTFLQFLSFLLYFSTPWVLARPSSPILNSDVDNFIQKVLSNWGSSGGVAVAVVQMDAQGNSVVQKKGYGNATVKGTKVTEDTLFGIGSNSKLFDIIATGLLMHNTSIIPPITWKTKISSLVPNWELEDAVATEYSTILDLMSHRTGLPRHDTMYSYNETISSIISRLKYLRPSAEFRDIWQYNNIMYMVLSTLPTHVLKHKPSFARYVKDNIFTPLGLKNTTYSYLLANASGLMAEGFTRAAVDLSVNPLAPGAPRPVPWLEPNTDEDGDMLSGHGGVIMSVSDAAVWLEALLLQGRNPETGAQVIPSEILSTVANGVLNSPGLSIINSEWPEISSTVYGGGQVSFSYRGHDVIEHAGTIFGFNTQITRLPYDGIGVAVFTNDDIYGGFFMDIIKYYLIDRALGLEPIDWNDRILQFVTYVYPGPPATPRPADAQPPTGGFESLAGKYYNPGYGSLELCYIPPNTTGVSSNLSNTTISPQPVTTSTNCNDLTSTLPILLPGAIDPTIPTYIARWDKASVDFVLLFHFDGNLFNATGLNSYPTNDPTSSPYYTHPPTSPSITGITAEFSVTSKSRSGFGITGIWGASGDVLPLQGKTVKARSEVWFDKV